MGLYSKQPPTVWMRSIAWHTYDGVPQPEGALYLAHEDWVETIEKVLKFAVREAPPLQARREPAATEATTAEPITTPKPKRGAKVMTTGDLPTPPKTP